MEIDTSIVRKVLEGTATASQAQKAAQWLATPEGQKWLAVEMELNPGYADIPDSEIPSQAQYLAILEKVGKAARRIRLRRVAIAVAAALVPAITLGAIWLDLRSRMGTSIFSKEETLMADNTRYGEKREIVFQDGTTVYLNSGSRIFYPRHFAIGERRVVLDGEARFNVSSNPRRPFIVEIGNAEVKVKGTVFNIKAFQGETTAIVSLIEGAIDFSYMGKDIEMSPDETIILDKTSGKITIKRSQNIVPADAWLDDVLTFNDQSASVVLRELERRYNVRFITDSDKAAACSLSFTTGAIPLERLLREIEYVSPLRFATRDDGIHVTVKYAQENN